MDNLIPKKLADELRDQINERMGLDFQKDNFTDFLFRVQQAFDDSDFNDIEKYIYHLLSAPFSDDIIKRLARYFAVGETYFFREPDTFQVLEKEILPYLIRKKANSTRELRIWSAGCSTGEEPYSIAILLARLIPDLENWNIKILGTDINSDSLDIGRNGIYGEWSFRGTPHWIKKDYFQEKEDGKFQISPSIRDLVHFSYLNLAADVYPYLFEQIQSVNLILCRNVLMYFSHAQIKKVAEHLFHYLETDGWFAVGSIEALHTLFSDYSRFHSRASVIYQRKESSENQTENRREIMTDIEAEDWSYQQDQKVPRIPEESFSSLSENPVPGNHIRDSSHRLEYAHKLYERGLYEDAVDNLKDYQRTNDVDILSTSLLAMTYANMGEKSDALYWCEQAINLEKLDPRLYRLKAIILQEQGCIEESISSLKQALFLDPNFVMDHFTLANLNRQQGKKQESAKYFRNSISILQDYHQEDILPETNGITAGQLRDIITSVRYGEQNG